MYLFHMEVRNCVPWNGIKFQCFPNFIIVLLYYFIYIYFTLKYNYILHIIILQHDKSFFNKFKIYVEHKYKRCQTSKRVITIDIKEKDKK